MDFDFECHHIEVGTPKYNTLLTEMTGMRKKARLLSSLPLKSWTLEFRGQTKDERDELLEHYNGQQGSTIPFNWTSVPSYIDDTSSYYVRYAVDGYEEKVIMSNIFEISVKFEQVL